PRAPRFALRFALLLERRRFADHAAALLARREMRRDLLELFMIELAIDKSCEQFGVAVVCHRVSHRETSPRAATEPSLIVDGRNSGVPRSVAISSTISVSSFGGRSRAPRPRVR